MPMPPPDLPELPDVIRMELVPPEPPDAAARPPDLPALRERSPEGEEINAYINLTRRLPGAATDPKVSSKTELAELIFDRIRAHSSCCVMI